MIIFSSFYFFFFFFQAEDGIRDHCVTGVQTCALPISLRHKAKLMMVKEARRQTAYLWLMSVPRLGAVSVAQLIAVVGTPYRFRSKRQFWTYVGLAVVTCSSADHEVEWHLAAQYTAASDAGFES